MLIEEGSSNENRIIVKEVVNYSTISNNEEGQLISQNHDILTEDIFNPTLLLKLCFNIMLTSIPVIFSYLIEFLNPFITSYTVGWLGKHELGSSALSTMYASITGWSFATGMTSSLDTLCSQAYTGSGDIRMVGVYAQRGFWASMILFLPISLTWLHAESILLYLGQDEILAELCGTYMRWQLLAVPPFIGFECIKKFLQAQGIMNASANILMLCLPICALLNYLLVWHPSTSIGFIGAPIAFSITIWLSFILGILYVAFIDGKKAWGGLTSKGFSNWGAIFKLGIPGVLMVCSEWWAYEVMAFLASYLGTLPLAAHGALVNLSGIFYQVAFGTGTVSSNLVGNCLGERHANRAKQTSIAFLILGATFGLISCTFIFFMEPYLKSFSNNDPGIVKLVAETLPIIAFFQVGDVTAAVANGILRGMGRQDIGAKLNTFAFYIVGIPTGILLAFHFDFGLKGLWIGFALGSATIALVAIPLALFADWNNEVEKAILRLDHS